MGGGPGAVSAAAALVAACAAFLLCAAAIPVLRRHALRHGLTDSPGGHKSHRRPTPYLGGVAIALGALVPPAVLAVPVDARITGILVGAAAMTLLGLMDDLSPLPPLTRLAVESLAAGIVVASGIQAPLTGGPLDAPVTLLWIVLITNSCNLLDNMDGSLGAVTAVSAALLAAAAFVSAQPAIGLVLITLSAAALGFLPYNWAPAKIFMGDAGSLFIGFVLASAAAAVAGGGGTGTAAAGLLLPAFVATVDTGTVLLSRRRAGRPLLRGGTDHLSHRLVRLGLGTRRTALVLAAVAAAAGVLDLMMTLGWLPSAGAALAGWTAACAGVVVSQRVRVYPVSVRPRKSLERR